MQLHVAELVQAHQHVALGLGVAGVLRRQLAANVEALLVGGEPASLIAPSQLHGAETVQAHRHVALRLGVAGVLRRQLAGDVEFFLVGGERAGHDAPLQQIGRAHV